MSFSCAVFSLGECDLPLEDVFLGTNMFGTLHYLRGEGESLQILPLTPLPPLLSSRSIPFTSTEKEGHGLVIKVDRSSLSPEVGLVASGPGGPLSRTMHGVSRKSLEEAVASLFRPNP